MNPTITRPTKADREEIQNLLSVTLKDAYKHEGILASHADELEEEIKAQYATFDRDLNSNGKEEYFLVAKIESKIIGIIAYGKANEIIQSNTKLDFETTPEIKSCYILPDYQNKGIGSLLFNAILKILQEHKIEKFCLDSGYMKAQKFWTYKIGRPAFVLKNYFGKGAHHFIWTGSIKDFMI